MALDLMIKNGFVVIPEAGVTKATLGIKDGKIASIYEAFSHVEAKEVIDVEGQYVLPGVIQPHAHLGRGEQWEDYATETLSAAIGGVTTVMVYHREKGDYGDDFLRARNLAGQQSYIDFAFHTMR